VTHGTEAEDQTATAVLMVRPKTFASNPETVASNAFQSRDRLAPDAQATALREFDAVVAALERASVTVHVFDGNAATACPDELFPNNWLSTHADGTIVRYPMHAPNRRPERRADILQALADVHGYRIARSIDLSHHEAHGRFLEGTGSLVLDRVHRVAYACRSPRTDERVAAEFASALDYTLIAFDASDDAGIPIYHTNVMLSIGSRFAVVCLETIRDAESRRRVQHSLERSGRSIIEIGLAQLHAFAANILELRARDGPIIALSARALAAFGNSARCELESFAALVPVAIPSIETYGGGSLRCMLAELFLER